MAPRPLAMYVYTSIIVYVTYSQHLKNPINGEVSYAFDV